ncbi:MFS transporter [Aspergillus saccharolyticus JOP 1030-1]|uniref:Nitrate/nitrite transporter n=1 Tax=Aspergillus saccharolyticus JOP 1030-1 TaxID=1450539 RepID=A0A318ZLG1_9EURO|nr:nitrate/nitrite transporter [Aspergillus saccharolyticus JOP 1030-1]PYH48439.1 nitrate/nitrite transporter [Aspergillus saccharolyticus JOP 1030-1]
MEFIKLLFVSPEINPSNRKAQSVPVLNPFDRYGRVFFFSWLGFMVAFLSWYAFPPLLTVTIRKDLHMSQQDVANSNIVALLATLLVRFVAGPLCDRFGPRLVFIGLLLSGAIPTAMAGLVTTPKGLIALRFFIGILGGTFVPCQVWCTGFFDKKIVGTANALAGGWGNAGGGITYFVMPAVYDSLVNSQGLTPHKAWRVAFIVPFIIIVAIAVAMLFLCEDTPTGKWSERHLWTREMAAESEGNIVDLKADVRSNQASTTPSMTMVMADVEKKGAQTPVSLGSGSQTIAEFDAIRADTVVAPTRKEAMEVLFSLSTAAVAIPYACSFGAELSINSNLGEYYSANFPHMGQTKTGQWAAMFGLLNVVFRPAGGFLADLLLRRTQNLWSKKLLLVFLGVIMGGFELAIGLTNPKSESTMFGLLAGLAFFLESCNGANFALVPHVYPFANGVVSGAVGGMGNLGGIIFAIIFRYNGSDYSRSLWIIGAISIAANVLVSWIRPVSKKQIVQR